MKDIQSQEDKRRINIKKVGVKTISYPVTVRDKAKASQQTIATVNMYVNLPHCFKGTHMSRFVEILNRYHGSIDLRNVQTILQDMKERLQSEASHMEIEFPYFLKNGLTEESLNVHRYNCMMCGSLVDDPDLEFRVSVPIHLPMSQLHGAPLPRSMGNWGEAKVSVRFNNFMWIEDLILAIEKQIGSEIESVADVEDGCLSVEALTKSIATRLQELDEVRSYTVSVENLCDDYSTFARVES